MLTAYWFTIGCLFLFYQVNISKTRLYNFHMRQKSFCLEGLIELDFMDIIASPVHLVVSVCYVRLISLEGECPFYPYHRLLMCFALYKTRNTQPGLWVEQRDVARNAFQVSPLLLFPHSTTRSFWSYTTYQKQFSLGERRSLFFG